MVQHGSMQVLYLYMSTQYTDYVLMRSIEAGINCEPVVGFTIPGQLVACEQTDYKYFSILLLCLYWPTNTCKFNKKSWELLTMEGKLENM